MKSVIFARVSSVSDRQNTERQISDLSQYAKNNNLNVIKVFEEKISGAKKNEERNVLMNCINYCIDNKIDTLLCSELSRIGRSQIDILQIINLLNENKINLHIQNIGFDTLNSDKSINACASIIISVMGQMAAIERSNIQYRLNSGRDNYIKNGGKLGRSKGTIKTKEQKKEEYSEAISLLKKGYSVRNIAKITGRGSATIMRIKKEFSL